MSEEEFTCNHDETWWQPEGIVMKDEGVLVRVWSCVQCPAWTKETLANQSYLNYHETPMYDND